MTTNSFSCRDARRVRAMRAYGRGALLLLLRATLAVFGALVLMTTWNASARAGDDYPWPNADPEQMSPLGFNYRYCTDFTAFRVNAQMGGAVSPVSAQKFNWSILTTHNGGRGNAIDWKRAVVNKWGASRVNATPKVGAVAWWGTSMSQWGHVGIVTAVFKDGSVQVEEYNGPGAALKWGVRPRPGAAAAVRADAYLHIADVTATTLPAAQYAGHIVQWKGDTKTQKTSWYVSADLRRLWIPNATTFYALKAMGAAGPDVLPAAVLDQLRDMEGHWAAAGDSMTARRTLRRGMYLRSPDGRFRLTLESSGMLVLSGPSGVLWSNGRSDVAYVAFQVNGNLTAFTDRDVAVWSTRTKDMDARRLVVRNDGQFVILNGIGTVLWSSAKPESYRGHIVQWAGDTKTQKTAWYVTSDLRRLWIPDSGTYDWLKGIGAPGPTKLPSNVLDELRDQVGFHAAAGSTMSHKRTLRRGMFLRSVDGRYSFTLRSNGNLVLSGPSGDMWNAGRSDIDYVVFQTDGNLVAYTNAGVAVWSTKTAGKGATIVRVRNDGQVVLLNSGGTLLWSSASPASFRGHIVQWSGDTKTQKTSWYVTSDQRRLWIPDTATYTWLKSIGAPGPTALPTNVLDRLSDQVGFHAAAGNGMTAGRTLRRGMYIKSSDGRFKMILQGDGNLVVYGPTGAIWSAKRSDIDYVVFQGDGNLVGYRNGAAASWASGTGGKGATSLTLQNDGRAVIRTAAGAELWATPLPPIAPVSGWPQRSGWAYRVALTRSWGTSSSPWFAVHIGSDRALYWSTNGSSWTRMASTWATDVAAYTNADGRVELFNVGGNGVIWHTWQTTPGGPFAPWVSRGGAFKAVAVTRGVSSGWHLFAINTSGALYHMAPADGIGGWTAMGNSPGSLTRVSAMRNGDGRVELLVCNGSGTMYHAWQTAPRGGWSGWQQQSGLARDVAIVPRGGGYWTMYHVGMSPSVYAKSYAGGNQWRQMLGMGANTVAASQNADGRQEVMCVGTNNGIYHAWQSSPTEW